MANGNTGFSIPGGYQPNILERIGAILGGQPDPIYKAQALDFESKMGMMKFQQGQEELKLKKEESERKAINDVLDFAVKFELDEETANNLIRGTPAIRNYFKGVDPDKLSFAPKKKGITVEWDFGEGELPNPLKPGEFAPKGRYAVTGVPTATGWKTIETIKAIKEPKGPSVGPDREALAQQAGFSSFADAPTDKKAEINIEVKRREDERIAQTGEKEGRLAGQFAQNLAMQERRLSQSEEKMRMLLPSQQKILTGNRTAIKTIDNYEKAFDDYVKESKGGTLSDLIRGGIVRNLNAQRAADLVFIEGRTPAEKTLAAEYNAMIGSVKSLTDEVGVLTDLDVPRIMGSFNPMVERGQFKANIAARRRMHQRSIDTSLEDYQAMGKDVSKFLQYGTKTQSREGPTETYERDPVTGKLKLKK